MKLKKLRNEIAKEIRRETGLKFAKAATLARIAVRYGGREATVHHIRCCKEAEEEVERAGVILAPKCEEIGDSEYPDQDWSMILTGPKGSIKIEPASQVRWKVVRGKELPRPMTKKEVADYFTV